MRLIIDDENAAAPNQPFAPPYPDLLALGTFKMRRDDAAGHVYISGFIKNIGNVAVHKSFGVSLGVRITRQSTSSFEIVYDTYKLLVVDQIIATGEQIETADSRVPLYYRENGNARYDIEMIVDVGNDITELKSSNNRSGIVWYFYRNSAKTNLDVVSIDKLAESKT